MANAIFAKHATLTRKRFKYLFRLHSMGIFFENIPEELDCLKILLRSLKKNLNKFFLKELP